jgi:hypothetical protein
MKKILLLCALGVFTMNASALNITIIESQSYNSGHTMDTIWYNLVTSLGHTATINPQTTLDDTLFFTATDILIVSSGVIDLLPNRVMIIQQYLQYGGKVYLQAEYLTTFTTNMAFESITNALGATFSWAPTTSGDLVPMNSFGSLGTTPNLVPPLDYFWYGTPGTGCNGIEPFLEYSGQHYGFVFCSSVSSGRMITTPDQDWVRAATAEDLLLMENIIYNLSLPSYACPATNQPVITLSYDSLISTAASTYQWYDYTGAIPGETNQVHMVTHPGWYHVCVTYLSGCTSCSDSIFVKIITGVNDINGDDFFTIYPNPFVNSFSIHVTDASLTDIRVSVYDMAGIMVYEKRFSANETAGPIEPGSLSAGIYMLEIITGEHRMTKKLVSVSH